MLLLFPNVGARAETVTLGWDPSPSPEVVGYRLLYGTESASYRNQVDLGKTLTFTLPNLDSLTRYFFTVTAHDKSGRQSGPSNEIAYPSPDALLNISTRAWIHRDDGALIGGFVITGMGGKKVIVRALGPSLPVSSALRDPILELYNERGELVAMNDNWRDDQLGDITATGVAPADNREAAIVKALAEGSYTVVMRGANHATGVGLVEVYDLGNARETIRLRNVSTRGNVLDGDNVLIGGIIVGGGDFWTAILARALGPTLADFGISQPLSDPVLSLVDGNGTLIASNDNWKDTQFSALELSGAAPTNDLEAAIELTLPSGNYTALVTGKGGAAGIGLIEVYNLN